MRIDGRWAAVALMVASGLVATPARALDHDNLDEGRPLRIEDAYPVPRGEIGVEAGATVHDRRGDGSGYGAGLRLLYGAWYNAQIELGGDLAFEGSAAAATERDGTATVGLLYNFNTESLTWPAFSARAEVAAPSGVGDAGLDASGGLIATRTFGRWRTHLNAAYTALGSSRPGERSGVYDGAVGLSYPLGYPMRFRETLIADVFTRQSSARDDPNTTGLEVGLRHQVSARVVLDGGVGSELFGPDERAAWFAIAGMSIGW
jgi:hypothetical protein